MMKRFGYTLSEVLITLGIIGVISAISIPSLINEYNKQVYTKSLQVAISDFENAMGAMMMKEGVFSILETRAWRHILNNKYTHVGEDYYWLQSNTSPANVIDGFMAEINKTLPIEEIGPYVQGQDIDFKMNGQDARLGNNYVRTYTKKFGYYYIIATRVNEYNRNDDIVLELVIDVNGKKPPNYAGKDIFFYELTNDGTLYPWRVDRKKDVILMQPMYKEPATLENLREMCTNLYSMFCSAYLWKNGYKMDY